MTLDRNTVASDLSRFDKKSKNMYLSKINILK